MEKGFLKAHSLAVAAFIVSVVSGVIALVGIGLTIHQIRTKYDEDAVGASRYDYKYDSRVSTDIGTYTMTKGTLMYVIEYAEDKSGQASATSTYTIQYKATSRSAYTLLQANVTLSGLRASTGTKYFMTNSNKSNKWNIKIDKTSGLDRYTRIGLLVISE